MALIQPDLFIFKKKLLTMDRRQHLCVGHTLMDQRLKKVKVLYYKSCMA
ncbi:putative uridine nucleosidase [Helianthus annuus]|nr:putative uridine nucleosidase [Helianthus annuus]